MLPIELKHESKTYRGDEEWESYLDSIGTYRNLDHEFLSQICYEHYERFNNYFPRFNIQKNTIKRITLTTEDIYSKIKYDNNQELNFWYEHINSESNLKSLSDYPILQTIINNGTWELPPVIIKNKLAKKLGDKNYGAPIHLIEGTHRVSYLRRWFEKGNIDKHKEHEFIIIE